MKRWIVVLAALVVLVGVAYGEAAIFTFRKIADTSTPIPGGSGQYTDFGIPSLARFSLIRRDVYPNVAERPCRTDFQVRRARVQYQREALSVEFTVGEMYGCLQDQG